MEREEVEGREREVEWEVEREEVEREEACNFW